MQTNIFNDFIFLMNELCDANVGWHHEKDARSCKEMTSMCYLFGPQEGRTEATEKFS